MQIEGQIRVLLAPVARTFAVAACHPGRGEKILLNENEVFPSASVIKVPLMVELFCMRDEGALSMEEMLILRDDCKVDGSGVLRELRDGLEITVRELTTLMIIVSDNTATNMLIDRAGIDAVNARMSGLGLSNIRLSRKMYDWEAARSGRENVCTAAELISLLQLICEGRISSNSTSMEMLDIMARQQYREKIPLFLPEGTKIANKTGSLTGVTHDAGIVYGPSGPYMLSILTKDVSDVPAAERTIARVSRLVYEHFNS